MLSLSPMKIGKMKDKREDKQRVQKYFVRFAYGVASLAELACIKSSKLHDFEILGYDETGALIECSDAVSAALIMRLGGSYKVCRMLSDDLEESLEGLPLPDEGKFNWTVSSYNSPKERFDATKEELRDYLRENDLGKGKFIDPEKPAAGNRRGSEKRPDDGEESSSDYVLELKAREILDRILMLPKGRQQNYSFPPSSSGQARGIDFVVHGGMHHGGSRGGFFAYTTKLSDILGYDTRDFGRPFQDPSRTMGPRLARMAVNCAISGSSVLFLDPFCGLGTILQEGVIIGLDVIGIDRDRSVLQEARANLLWLQGVYKTKRHTTFLHGDATRLGGIKVDCIGTEPILLPRYRDNPTKQVAVADTLRAGELYSRSLYAMALTLRRSDSKLVIISPTVVDSFGRNHELYLEESARRAGLKYYSPSGLDIALGFPIKIETSKKKTVQRNLNIFTLS